MRILIDGDGCPVVKESIDLAKSFGMEAIVFVDTSHIIKSNYARVVTVSKGHDSADFKLINMTSKGDIIITQDYGVATMGLVKGCIVLNENGFRYTNENIDELLSNRHMFKKALKAGHRVPHKKKRTREKDQMFIESLRRIIKENIKS